MFLSSSANLCKPIHDIINYSFSICPFVSEKCGKEGKPMNENEKSYLDKIKNTFHSFERLWCKTENFIKNRGHKL